MDNKTLKEWSLKHNAIVLRFSDEFFSRCKLHESAFLESREGRRNKIVGTILEANKFWKPLKHYNQSYIFFINIKLKMNENNVLEETTMMDKIESEWGGDGGIAR